MTDLKLFFTLISPDTDKDSNWYNKIDAVYS